MIDEKEQARRDKISASAKASQARQDYYDRRRGVKKGPDSLKTRAAKSASHLAKRGTPEWQVAYEIALKRFKLEEELKEKLGR